MMAAICTVAGVALLLASVEIRIRIGINWYGIAMLIAAAALMLAGVIL